VSKEKAARAEKTASAIPASSRAEGSAAASWRPPPYGIALADGAGLPGLLKAGLEALSGLDLSHVRVHRGSSRPEQVHAQAYTQGAEIHLALGQERHLAHEGWHVVQQMQGRVQSTRQVNGQGINDNPALEREADVMGARAALLSPAPAARGDRFGPQGATPAGAIQRVGAVLKGQLEAAYASAAGHDAQVDAMPDAPVQCLINRVGALGGLVANWGNFMQLYNFINCNWGGAGAYDGRAQALIDYNQHFGTALRSLPIRADQFANLQALLADVGALPDGTRGEIRAVFAAAGIDHLLERHVAAANKARVLNMIAACHRTGGVRGLISVDRLAELEAIYAAYPPGGDFGGFTEWGEGNKGSADENLTEHCMKHVFYVFEEGETAPPMKEIEVWWEALGVRLQLSDVLARVADKHYPPASALDRDLQGAFGAGYRAGAAGIRLDPKNAEHVRMLAYLMKTYDDLSFYLLGRFRATYGNEAVRSSRVMGDVQVHLSQGSYFISGASGSLYIVARIENANATISSAYWTRDPTVKVNAASQERLWTL
jgi:hypothetical protein